MDNGPTFVLAVMLIVATAMGQSRQQSDLTYGGCQFTEQLAHRAAARVEKDPEDLISRAQLVGYYGCALQRVSGDLPIRFDWDEYLSEYIKQLVELIERDPSNPLLGMENADPGYTSWVTREKFELVREAWASAVQDNPEDVRVLDNAAYGVSYTDPETAIDLLARVLKLQPQNERYRERFGRELGKAVMQIRRLDREGEFHQAESEAAVRLAKIAREMISSTADAVVIRRAAVELIHWPDDLTVEDKVRTEYRVLGEQWLARAREMSPDDPYWNQRESTRPDYGKKLYDGYRRRREEAKWPRFEDFPVTGVYQGPPAEPAIELGPDQDPSLIVNRMEWSVFYTIKKGSTFAGRYALATSGCGTACVEAELVDVSTGAIYDTPFSVWSYDFFNWDPEDPDRLALSYRIDSSLVIAEGCPQDRKCGKYAYHLDGTSFRLLKRVLIDPSEGDTYQ